MKSMYRTTNGDYNPAWMEQEKKEVPTYTEIGKMLPDLRRQEKLIKNQTVAAKRGQSEDAKLDELSRMRKNLDRNSIVAKQFPVKPEEYNYPGQGLKVGTPLYMTTNMDIGRLKPSHYEVPERFYPLNAKFTQQYPGPYRNQGLNVAYTFSKTHKTLDGII